MGASEYVAGDVWHFWQATPRWEPVSLYCVVAWSKAAGRHALVEWHVPQLPAKLRSCAAGLSWQDAHDVEVDAGGATVWHRRQDTAAWAPVSLNVVVS